jgi:hypothetical protein
MEPLVVPSLSSVRRVVDCVDAASAVAGVRALGRRRILSFVGFSASGYDDEDQLRETLRKELARFSPTDTLVCAGATPDGIGMVYPVALKKGFRTAGIVSSHGRAQGAVFSTGCDVVFVVDDRAWGGWLDDGRLSPTSQAMCEACDVMIGIGGGAIAGAELSEARRMGKAVRFRRADMNHGLAIERAARADEAPPDDFAGAAQKLFADS